MFEYDPMNCEYSPFSFVLSDDVFIIGILVDDYLFDLIIVYIVPFFII